MNIYKNKDIIIAKDAEKHIHKAESQFTKNLVEAEDYDLMRTEVQKPAYDKMHNVYEWDDNHTSYAYGAYRKKPDFIKQKDKFSKIQGVRDGLIKREGAINYGIPNIKFNMGEFL